MSITDIEDCLAQQNHETHKISPEQQLARAKYFLACLDNPQEKIKTIHVAGTSGKGSTSYLTSLLLRAQGLKVGLFQSPHIVDLREMFQVNNLSISNDKFIQYFQDIMQFIDDAKTGEYGPTSSFEILTGLAFYIFLKERVDYAVIETGLGGLYDATNVIQNRNNLVILTKIGLDHTEFLGGTLPAIAAHKAGIIQHENTTISIEQEEDVEAVFTKAAKKQDAPLSFIRRDTNFSITSLGTTKTIFGFRFLGISIEGIALGLAGSYQVENCSEALAAIISLSKRDGFALNKKRIYEALEAAHLPGRLEIKRVNDMLIILDGAHNPQKMSLFIQNVADLFPGKKFDFLLAFKKGKDYADMLRYITPLADKIVISSFHVSNMALDQASEDPTEIEEALDELGFTNYVVIPDAKRALKRMMRSSDALIVTGSLYLIATIYPLFEQRD